MRHRRIAALKLQTAQTASSDTFFGDIDDIGNLTIFLLDLDLTVTINPIRIRLPATPISGRGLLTTPPP